MKGVVLLLLAVAATEAQPEQSNAKRREPEKPEREAGKKPERREAKKAELDDGKKGFFCTSDWDCSLVPFPSSPSQPLSILAASVPACSAPAPPLL